MSDLERMINTIADGAKADTDWMFESYNRALDDTDKKLAAAEALLTKGLHYIKAQRDRIRAVREPESERPKLVQGGPNERRQVAAVQQNR